MSAKFLDTDFNKLKSFVQSLFVESPSCFQKMVTVEEQEQEIDLLRQTLGGERFLFIIDMADFEISKLVGINRWLGYSESQFSLQEYWDNVVHPQCQKSLLMIAHQLYGSLCTGKYPLQFMVQRYSSRVALKHRDGHYVLAKKTSSIFQYDDHNRLLSYMNEFTIIGDYDGEPLEPRMYNSFGDRETEKENEILAKTMEKFLNMKIFSPKELQTARKLAYDIDATQSSIAAEFNVSRYTIDTFYKRFLDKARNFFGKEFRSANEAAVFLRKEGLL
jgi:hypothetical protein